MSFKLPDSYQKFKKDDYNNKFITIGDKRMHVSELEDRSVTPERYRDMRMNSYAQDDLPPKLTDETLIKKAKYHLSQCRESAYPCTTYDEALIHKIVPELIKRLEEKSSY